MNRTPSRPAGPRSGPNATDLRRRSAVKSIPPTRDYSASSNQSHRLSLLTAVQPTQILPHHLVESPPQVDFIPDLDDTTLSWQPEVEEEDEARKVWRKLEMKMGRRMHSGLEEQRGRWVMTPAAVEMSPGQFSVSDYMAFGEAYEPVSYGRAEESGVQQAVRGTPYPPELRRSRRTKSRRASPNVLDTLDDSLFPTFAPAEKPKPKPSRSILSRPSAKPQPPRPKPSKTSPPPTLRLDTHVISALEALKSDWDSPDLDMALGNISRSPSPPVSRPLPMPALTRRSASPAYTQISTPPRAPIPLSPLERGLGLGMSLGTTYNLPSKPTPILPQKSTRPLPSPAASRKSTALSRKSTICVEKGEMGMFVIRDLDTGEALEVEVEGLEAALFEMASRA